jgi:hypothetical protein
MVAACIRSFGLKQFRRQFFARHFTHGLFLLRLADNPSRGLAMYPDLKKPFGVRPLSLASWVESLLRTFASRHYGFYATLQCARQSFIDASPDFHTGVL